jgi:hypothetical protein
MSTSADPKMASSDPTKHNNDVFKLEELFDVKDKVALVTGKMGNFGPPGAAMLMTSPRRWHRHRSDGNPSSCC